MQNKPLSKGKHWALKVKEGNPPKPWKHMKEWSEKTKLVEIKLKKILEEKKITNIVFPWDLENIKCGNTTKVHYMEIYIHHLNNTATINFFDHIDKGFYGIKSISISKEQQPLFDEGYIPSINGKRSTYNITQIKTLTKIWHKSGFKEYISDNEILYIFDQHIFNNLKQQMQRNIHKRKYQYDDKYDEQPNKKQTINFIINT
jgi:hypothetical protein